MSTTSKPDRTLVSLFAGCGGSSLGYKQAGFDIKLAVEWDTKAADVYKRNFDGTQMFVGDIADLTSEEALEITGLQPGELDVLDGSPPCQGFSTAGKRKFSDSRNQLFHEYVRIVEGLQPRVFVMENVSGMIKGKMKLMFAEMTRALKATGYSVSCRLLNAWWYGVPQDRRRLIWIGVRPDLGWEPSHPVPLVKSPVSVAEALGVKGSITWYERGGFAKGLPPKSIRKRDGAKSLFPTLAAQGFGGERRSMALINRDGQIGELTIEEAKILQGFPEWFDIQEKEYKFIGNSVCPPMAEAIGNHLSNLLDTG
jgi:DNA (cytosine-5)-methyltransferase 1